MRHTKYMRITFFLLLVVWVATAITQTNTELKTSLQFKNLHGDKESLQNYMGEITIVNLWSTWSVSCIKEMPVLERIYQDYNAQNVKVVGIAVYSDQRKIGQMLRLTKVSYPILIANKNQASVFKNLSIIPQTYILNSRGAVVAHFNGSQTYETLAGILKNLLDAQTLSKNMD